MSIYALEAATAFGALDYDAIVDGVPVDANRARTMVRQSNRLIRKRQQLLQLTWPSRLDDGAYRVELVAPIAWEPILAPLSIRKKPGLTVADIYLRVRVPSGRQVRFGFGTRAQPDPSQATILHTGTGAWEYITRELVLDPGASETLLLCARAEGEGALMDTATYGAPNTDTLEDYALTGSSLYSVASPQPTWDEVAIAHAGHYVRMLVRGQPLMSRQILHGNSAVNNDHALHFAESSYVADIVRLAPGMVGLPRVPIYIDAGLDSDPANNTWEIRELAWYALAQVLLVAQERAL